MTNVTEPATLPQSSTTSLDRVLDRVLDFFDEFDGEDLRNSTYGERALANLAVLQLRIAAALWLFGDVRRAYHLGFPTEPDAQRRALDDCAGDSPRRFLATYALDGAIHETERMALCILQAEVEFRWTLKESFGERAVLTSLGAVAEDSQE
jgi:hypothetical protein